MIRIDENEEVFKEIHKALQDVKEAIQYFFEEQDLFDHMHLLYEAEEIIDEVGRMITEKYVIKQKTSNLKRCRRKISNSCERR